MIAETLKRLFCKHEWELKHCIAIQGENDKIPVGYKDVYCRCQESRGFSHERFKFVKSA